MKLRRILHRLVDNTFWHSFKFTYKISVVNENTLEESIGMRMSKREGLFVLITILIVAFVLAGATLIYTPLRNYLPGYMSDAIRTQMVTNMLQIDSLKEVVTKQSFYVMNIQDIFRGTVSPDSAATIEELTNLRQDSLLTRSEAEMAFRRQYEEAEKYNLTAINLEAEADGLLFEAPARGTIVQHFNMDARRYGIDIAAAPNSNVLSVLDGKVVISTYTPTHGYVMAILHKKEFLSVYKHCGTLLKKEGDTVQVGEVIALVGAGKDVSSGPHLHLELWHKGQPINPESFIVF